MRISIGVVWLKGAFHACTGSLKTPSDKKKGLIGVLKIKLYTNIIITFINIGGWLLQFIIVT